MAAPKTWPGENLPSLPLGVDENHAVGGAGAVQRRRGRAWQDFDVIDGGGIQLIQHRGLRVPAEHSAALSPRRRLAADPEFAARYPDSIDVNERITRGEEALETSQPNTGSGTQLPA